MKIIVTGATGLVGSEVVRQAVLDNDIEEITALVRKPLDFQHPKVRILIHKDFLDYSGMEDVFNAHDACIWCLGISQSQVSKEEYTVITYDYALAAAQAILQVHPSITFLFTSGMGADTTETSKTLFARVKGKTENALIRLGLKRLYIVRPGGIQPIHKNKNTAFINKLMIPLYPLLMFIMPSMMITSVELARVILHIVKHGSDKQVMENRDLKNLLKVLP